MKQFEALGLNSEILRALGALGYETPTAIQREAIPLVLSRCDIMGLAQTGTGKTAAFGLPLAQLLMEDRKRPGARSISALILAPTRELVSQIADNLKRFTRDTQLRVRCVVGGASIGRQAQELQRGADILIATPGRLLDLVERGAVALGSARYLVLDEADQMLDLGFIHALRRIAKLVGTPRQTLLFSATMPKQIEELSRAYLSDPARVQVAASGKAADKVRQSVHFVEQNRKADLLKQLLADREDDLSLVFARTKHGAEKLMKNLVAAGHSAASIHGNKSQNQRERAIRAFRDGEIRVLVATDVAARGIDIPGVSHVYNYDLPEVAESYVHRIGRTARAGADGKAVAFCSGAEKSSLRAIEKLMGLRIDVAGAEEASVEAGEEAGAGADRRAPRGRKPQAARGETRQAGHSRPNGRSEQKPRNPKQAKPAAGGSRKPMAGSRGAVEYGAAFDAPAARRDGQDSLPHWLVTPVAEMARGAANANGDNAKRNRRRKRRRAAA